MTLGREPPRLRDSAFGSARPPFSPPEWITPTRVAVAIVAVTAALTTTLLTAWIPASGSLRVALFGLGLLTSALLARWACTARDPSRAVLRSMGAGALHAFVFGGLVAPAFVSLTQETSAPGLFVAFAIGATMLGVPFGGATGLVYAFVPAVAARVRARPSHAGLDRVATVGGVWLIAVAAVHALAVAGTGPHDATVAAAALWAVPLVMGECLLLVAGVRRALCRRFLTTVRAGTNAEYRIAPRAPHEQEAADVLPLLDGLAPHECESVLVRVGARPREVLYREAARPEREERVVALLP